MPATDVERFIIVSDVLVVEVGVIAAVVDVHWFKSGYAVEDGYVETRPLATLLSISSLMFYGFPAIGYRYKAARATRKKTVLLRT